MKTHHFIATLLLMIMLYGSCNIINPAEPIPSYLQIDTMMLTTDYATEGSASHKIKDAWVYVDNQLVGAYEMPCHFPLLITGEHYISIRGGILLNGINATHLQYPYYQFIDKKVTLKSGETAKLTGLTTTYLNNLTFALSEDFSGLFSFEKSSSSPVGMIGEFDASQAMEGGYGVVKLDTGMYNFEVKSKEMVLPNNGTNVYLEMNYKNSASFVVALQATDPYGNVINNQIITLNARAEWNKIYIELKPTMQATSTATRFRLLFGMQRSEASSKETFYFDNVKVVHN
jgi:hypothetical protein